MQKKSGRIGRLFPYLLAIPPLLFLVIFYLYPMGTILQLSFASFGSATWHELNDSYYWEIGRFSLWQATLSTLLTVGLAVPGAYFFATYSFRGKRLLQALITLPFVLPTVVVATSFNALLGTRGVLNEALSGWGLPALQWEHSLGMILLAHLFYNYSVAIRILTTYWQTLHPQLQEAGQMLGANRWTIFRTITLPLLRPAMIGASLLVFIFCFTSFGVILILGGPRFATLEVEIYRQSVYLFNLPIAGALSLIQISMTAILLGVYTAWQKRLIFNGRSAESPLRPIRTKSDYLIAILNLGLVLPLIVAPIVALLGRSLTNQNGLTLNYYQQLFSGQRNDLLSISPLVAIQNSLGIALATTALAVTLGLCTIQLLEQSRHARWFDLLLMLPLATSAVTLGFGYLIALDEPPLNLRQSPLLLPFAHCLIALPFVVRSVMPTLRSLPASLGESAELLGATPFYRWKTITWPLIRRSVVVGAIFAFTISMGEFGATSLLARPQQATIPLAIFRLLGQPGALNYGQALAMSGVLMFVCVVTFLIMEIDGVEF